jgi:hypothetical protein
VAPSTPILEIAIHSYDAAVTAIGRHIAAIISRALNAVVRGYLLLERKTGEGLMYSILDIIRANMTRIIRP